MPRINFAKLLLVVVLTFSAQLASAFTLITVYQVGHCKFRLKKIPAYNTISDALAATPAPDVVEVCPGTYNEQIEITRPVILEGIKSADSDQVIIAPPAGGFVQNAKNYFGEFIAAQIWVNNATGPVTITDITLDAANELEVFGADVTGIFYQNSDGTVNRVTARNQAYGVWLEGGAQSVTIESSSIHDFSHIGIFVLPPSQTPKFTAIIGDNVLKSSQQFSTGVDLWFVTAEVTNNLVTDAVTGILVGNGTIGSKISGNTLTDNQVGVVVATLDGVSLTSNKIYNSTGQAITLESPIGVEDIVGNSIINTPVGIEFNCLANGNVKSNTIIDAGTALDMVPLATTSNNSYSNVGTIRTGGCP